MADALNRNGNVGLEASGTTNNIKFAVQSAEDQYFENQSIIRSYVRSVLAEAQLQGATGSQQFFYGSRSINPATSKTRTILRTEQVVRNAEGVLNRNTFNALSSISLSAVVNAALGSVTGDVAAKLTAFADDFGRTAVGKAGLQSRMERVATAARLATLDAYYSIVPSSSYRRGDRLVGAVGAALARSGWCFPTTDGVVFGNTGLLDAEAANWRRLNFGALPAGASKDHLDGYAPGTMFLSLDSRAPGEQGIPIIGKFGLRPQPSPSFRLPAGFFVTDEESGTIAGRGAGRGQPFFTLPQYNAEFGAPRLPDNIKVNSRRHFYNTLGGDTVGVHGGKSRKIQKDSSLPRGISPRALVQVQTRGIVGYHFMDVGVKSIRSGPNSFPAAVSETINEWLAKASNAAKGL